MMHGFTVLSHPNGVQFRFHRLSAGDRPSLLTFARTASGHAAVLFGCLYYQDELRARLGVSPVEDTTDSRDAALALRAYVRWGDEALVHLEGDFAVVFWDPISACLVAARDPLGGYPLFWTGCEGTLAFSTSLFDLLELRPGRNLDYDYLADFLAMSDQNNEVATEATVYQGVRRVLPASVVHAEIRSGRVDQRRYWNWLEHLEDPGTGRLEEVALRYGHLLRTAVRQRFRGRCFTHLSGGMDSTAVTLLALGLRRTVGSAPLHSLSLVYERLPKLARERPYVEEVLAGATGLSPHRLPADDLLDFDAFADPPPHEEPYAALWRMALDRHLLTVAADAGADTVLTGCGADELLDAKPYHLADLLRRGWLLRAWREAVRWGMARNCNAWAVLGPFGLGGCSWFPRWLGKLGGSDRFGLTDPEVPVWVVPDFARRYSLAERMRAARRKPYAHTQRVLMSVAVSALSDRPGDVVRWAVAAPAGIAYGHPFQDRRVLALALGLLDRSPPQPGPMKPLLASALGDLLPARITERRAKGHFDELFYLGLARNLSCLEELVRHSPLRAMGILDTAALSGTIEAASFGGRNGRQLCPMTRSLCLACWLAHHERWQRQRTPPDEMVMVEHRHPGSNQPAPQAFRSVGTKGGLIHV